MNALTIAAVGASYGARRVLHDFDLHVDKGEMLAVLGPSGCGKTTLLRSIAGLHRIDTGTIEIDGAVVARSGGSSLPPERRRVGLMPQEGALFPHLSVAGNIEFGLRSRAQKIHYGSRASRRFRVQELAELVGLPDALKARPSELSGGQQQRVALARALAPSPALILMDEPFAALDAGLRAGLRVEVRDLLRHSGTASILVTHDQQEALSTADRIAVVLGGTCAQTDHPRELYRRPRSRRVAEFVGDAYFVDASPTSGSTVQTIFGSLEVAGPMDSGKDSVMLRPEYLVMSASPTGEFMVRSTQFTGPSTLVTLVHRSSGTVVLGSTRAPVDLEVGSCQTVTIDRPVALI